MLDQIVWNNRFTKINKASLYYRNWHQAGIYKLCCLVYGNKQRFLSFMISEENLTQSSLFLQYYGLLSAISSDWKSYLKLERHAATVNVPAVNKLTCKTMYSTLIKHRNSSPPTAEKRLKEFHFDTHERHKIYNTRSFIISSTHTACCIKRKKLKVLIVPFSRT